MRNYFIRLVLILLILLSSWFLAFPWEYVGNNSWNLGKDYKLWLDLHGWVELDYKIDLEEAKKKPWYNESSVIEWLKSIVEKRVNSLGKAEPTIMASKYWNEAHIVVQIPTANYEWLNLTSEQKKIKNEEDIAKAKETIGKVVRLEFKEQKTEITDEDLLERQKIAQDVFNEIKNWMDFEVVANKYSEKYENIVFSKDTYTNENIPSELSFTWMENIQTPYISEIIESQKSPSFAMWEDGKLITQEGEKGYSIIKINSVKKEEKIKEVETWSWETKTKKQEKYTQITYNLAWIFISQKPSEWTPAKTAAGDVLDERYLIRANSSLGANWLTPQVDLTFNDKWAKIFAELTKRLLNKQLAIFVWWELLTAPTIQSVIPDGKAQISWSYTVESAQKLANDINTWIVPAPIYLTSEKSIDAKIGWDSLKTIIYAWVIGFIFILVFLTIFYRFAWILAWIALLAYILITLAVVKFSWVVLTLASIAWLILSVWLAIDANILIFERTKEELQKNNEVGKSLLIWFEKSWSAIWDSHVTSFVSAVILYMIWINLIKWFGLMLGIGIIVSLFSAMWISRVLVEYFAYKFNKNLNLFIGLKK